MKKLNAFYDCQICGKKHPLKAKWKFKAEVELKEYHGVDFEQQVREAITEIAKEVFRKAHPDGTFQWDRLHCQ